MAWIGQERVELYFYSHIRLHGSVKAQEQLYLYLVQKPVMLTEVSRGFHQSFHENTGIVFMSLPVIFLKTIIKISMFRDTMPPNSQHNVMEHSPFWEANTHSASQGIARLLRNPKVHYCLQNLPPLWPTLMWLFSINFHMQTAHASASPIRLVRSSSCCSDKFPRCLVSSRPLG